MSYNPPKNMYKDEYGVARFNDPGTAPDAGRGKRLFHGVITRRTDVLRNKQEADVFATEDEVIGAIVRQCPNPWAGQDVGEVKTNIFFTKVK